MKKKLLTIGHSYVVALNRRLPNEMARIGGDDWDITVVSPQFVHGDLRPITCQPDSNDICRLEMVPVYLSQKVHLMVYSGRLKQILQEPWDLIHCWQEPYIFSGGQVAWWNEQKIPIVYATFQNYSKQYFPPFNFIEQYSMSNAVGWIAFSETVMSALGNRSGYHSPVKIIPPGVDTAHFFLSPESRQHIKQQLGWQDSEIPVIGYLGRLVPEKGLDLLMEVLDALSEPWRALIVGAGPMENTLRQWAQKYGQEVKICTDVQHNDVPQYLNAMDMLVAPSQTMPNWREQFGRMLIEAFACGVPVIGSDSGEIPYVLAGAGIVVGEKDTAGWVETISALIADPQRRQSMAEAGLAKAQGLYSWKAVAQQHLDFFGDLIKH